jgi:hypothetical protein
MKGNNHLFYLFQMIDAFTQKINHEIIASVILVLSIRSLVRHLNHKTPDEQTIYRQTPIAEYKVGIYLDNKYQVTASLEV